MAVFAGEEDADDGGEEEMEEMEEMDDEYNEDDEALHVSSRVCTGLDLLFASAAISHFFHFFLTNTADNDCRMEKREMVGTRLVTERQSQSKPIFLV